MYKLSIKHRLYLLFKNKNKRISYLKKLPPEELLKLRNGAFPYTWLIKDPHTIYKNIIHLFKAARYHLSSNKRVNIDWWNLDTQLAYWILPRLRMLRKCSHGHPINLPPYDRNIHQTDDSQHENWLLVIDDIIFAFEYPLILELRFLGCPPTDPLHPLSDILKQMEERKNRGLHYFVLYYNDLWD